jgi:hypothetical protein
MLAASHIFVAVVCAMILTGCDRITEAKLFGTWRAEDGETVYEISCGRDHTFTAWTDVKNELTTPSCLISSGEWQLTGQQLVVHFTKHVAVDSWENEDTRTSFAVLKITGDTLLMKNFDGSKVFTYHRLSPECVLSPMKRAPTDADFIGTWRIHYHTRDYEMTFNQDHTGSDFAWIDGVRKQLFTGIWRIESNHLSIDSTSVPAFDGDSVRKSWLRWLVTGIEPERISMKDGPVSYCLERSK